MDKQETVRALDEESNDGALSSVPLDRLVSCFCGHQAASYPMRICAKGCEFSGWVVECTHDDDQEIKPFVEHRVTVYGETQAQAEQRWNELFTANNSSEARRHE